MVEHKKLGRRVHILWHSWEIFAEFPIVLHKWLSMLATRQKNFQRREAVKWSAQLIHEITNVSNPIYRAVDFWLDSILQGYITEFTVETITSNSEAERKFFQGPWRRYLLSINTWIKMLVYEKGILQLSNWVAYPEEGICHRWSAEKMGNGELICSHEVHNLE